MMRHPLLLVLIVSFSGPMQAFGDGAVEFGISTLTVSEHFSIGELVDTIENPPKSGDYAASFTRQWLGLQVGRLSIKQVNRLEAIIRLNNDAAAFIYQGETGSDVAPETRYELSFRSFFHNAGGLEIGYSIPVGDRLEITPRLSKLNADMLIDGAVSGFAGSNDQGDYSGDIRVDYHYTEDRIFDRVMDVEPVAEGYTLGVDIEGWLTDTWRLDVSIIDLYGELLWESAGYTTARSFSDPEPAGDLFEYYKTALITGSETSENFRQELPVKLDAQTFCTSGLAAVGLAVQGEVDRLYYSPMVGLWSESLSVFLLAEPGSGSLGISFMSEYADVRVISDRTEWRDSRFLRFDAGFRFPLW